MEKLYQCDSCKHLYHEKITQCDCTDDGETRFNDFFAFSDEEIKKVGVRLESFMLLTSLGNVKYKINQIKKMLNI
jgi:hypothetical protein